MFFKAKQLVITAFFLLLSGTVCADELVSVKLGYQLLAPEGSVAGTIDGVGTNLDIENDLNLDDSEEFTGEVALQWGKFQTFI